MLRSLVVGLRAKLTTRRTERALAGLPERVRRDVGVATEQSSATHATGMIHALDPALLRVLVDPHPLAPTADAARHTVPGRTLDGWIGAYHIPKVGYSRG